MTRIVAATVLLIVLSVVGWWFLLFQPARQQAAALGGETAALLATEAQLTNQRTQLLDLREQAPVLRDELDRLSALVPPDPDQARLLELVQGAADAAGVAFTSLSFTEPLPVEGAPTPADPAVVLGSTTVIGSMRATYFQLVDFLRRLEVGSSRAILVTSVGLLEGPDGFPQLDASFTAEIFSLIPPPVLDVVDPTVVQPEGGVAAIPTVAPTETVLPTVPPAVTATETADGAQSPVPSAGAGQ
jgi:hypothetical protein